MHNILQDIRVDIKIYYRISFRDLSLSFFVDFMLENFSEKYVCYSCDSYLLLGIVETLCDSR